MPTGYSNVSLYIVKVFQYMVKAYMDMVNVPKWHVTHIHGHDTSHIGHDKSPQLHVKNLTGTGKCPPWYGEVSLDMMKISQYMVKASIEMVNVLRHDRSQPGHDVMSALHVKSL
jgi:hypothetical protein